jgi:hypothetical protein
MINTINIQAATKSISFVAPVEEIGPRFFRQLIETMRHADSVVEFGISLWQDERMMWHLHEKKWATQSNRHHLSLLALLSL